MKVFSKKQWRWIIVILIFCSGFFIYYNQTIFSKKLASLLLIIRADIWELPDADTEQSKMDVPVRLKIKAIGIDAVIESVGINLAGEMEVPKDYNNVAWFNLGPFPGAEGSAVIAGHFDNEHGQKAVFYNLNKLKIGEQLFIEDKKGKVIVFVVRGMYYYDSYNLVPEVFLSSEGQYLNLITCAGAWDHFKKEYTERLVVFTEQE